MKTTELKLEENPRLQKFQEYVKEMVKKRGFEKESITVIYMLFAEECGEMAKAIRKLQNIKTDNNSQKFDLSDEIADVFIYLLDICNFFDIDLEQAFRIKEEKNKLRNWK